MRKFLLNNIGLKLLALLLAIITWVYIIGELTKTKPEERAALERLLPYRMTAKFLPVQVNFTGKLVEGYEIVEENIKISPDGIMVVGPRSLLGRITSVKTEPVDLSENTKTFSREVSLMPLARGLSVKEKFVSLEVPVRKIKE